MSYGYLAIRALHVLAGAFWLGATVFAAWWVMPSMQDAGPDAVKVMQGMQRRGIMALFPILAGVTVLTGLWLFWRYTGHFSPEVSRSHAGMAFGFGGVTGILAFIVGAVTGASMGRANRTAAQAASAPEKERAALMATVTQLRQRAAAANRLTAALLVVTIVLMSIALYV